VPVEKRAVPPPSAAEGDDWSDFADPDADARAGAFAAASGAAAPEPDGVVEPEPDTRAQAAARDPRATADPADDGEWGGLAEPNADVTASAPSGDEPTASVAKASEHGAAEISEPEAPAEANPKRAVADDDWSDVTAAVADPIARAAAATTSSAKSPASEAVAEPDETCPDDDEDDGDTAFDDDPKLDSNAPVAPTELQSENRQHRLRALNAVEQLKVARRGELSDRVVVERLYGKQVWEALLQNPRITLPEVARIARKGTVPRPLIETILDNAMWTKAPNVRRALLSNPKLTGDGVMKLLRMLPKHELKFMEKATAYPMAVRDAARKLLREGAP
jgi:hypothetical protein